MNIIEKQAVKFAWRKVMTKNLKRFVPLIAVAYIAALTLARAFGAEGVANALSTVGPIIGLDSASPVTSAEFTAAAAALAGVCIKVYNVVRALRAE